MNMRAIFLHALGDALGNVGVILTGLLIWLVPRTDGTGNAGKNGWIVYADPAISLVITVIIFTSALPLVRSASLILLQGTPSHVKLDVVQKSLEAIEGVLQLKLLTELHIWSLSELKLVASVHVLIKKQEDFVKISRHIRKTLHQCGIHSSTISTRDPPRRASPESQGRCRPPLHYLPPAAPVQPPLQLPISQILSTQMDVCSNVTKPAPKKLAVLLVACSLGPCS
ncbi:hypothetical protein KEM48_011127 [Puccinia striiformis f. sp. tritici PST-130]|nr:hypothetical protein KEM48_011127 [Puccinia striiformis f. sp. tritici PST-130]